MPLWLLFIALTIAPFAINDAQATRTVVDAVVADTNYYKPYKTTDDDGDTVNHPARWEVVFKYGKLTYPIDTKSNYDGFKLGDKRSFYLFKGSLFKNNWLRWKKDV
jgi:hypothetical protein